MQLTETIHYCLADNIFVTFTAIIRGRIISSQNIGNAKTTFSTTLNCRRHRRCRCGIGDGGGGGGFLVTSFKIFTTFDTIAMVIIVILISTHAHFQSFKRLKIILFAFIL